MSTWHKCSRIQTRSEPRISLARKSVCSYLSDTQCDKALPLRGVSRRSQALNNTHAICPAARLLPSGRGDCSDGTISGKDQGSCGNDRGQSGITFVLLDTLRVTDQADEICLGLLLGKRRIARSLSADRWRVQTQVNRLGLAALRACPLLYTHSVSRATTIPQVRGLQGQMIPQFQGRIIPH